MSLEETTAGSATAATTVEPRRKRVKIVSACGECRRKKTKCNGELPCRNCEKSGVECIYPASSNDDKKNASSKVALEAIEERLKTIEEMLRIIISSNPSMTEMTPLINIVNNRENIANNNRESISSSPSISSPPSTTFTFHHHIQQQQTSISNPPPTTVNKPNSPTQQHSRLPSIRALSSSYPTEPKLENRDLPPLGFQNYVSNPMNESTKDDFMKKRKR